jgi:cell division initiation protein
MITGIEIRNHQFKKSLNGYNRNEVQNFINQWAQDYENLYLENSKLKEKIKGLEADLGRYEKIEGTLNDSIVVAQQAAQMVKENARREANIILEDSKKKVAEIFTIYQEVIKRLNLINVEIKSQLSTELELLNKNQNRIEELSTFFYGKDIKNLLESLEKINLDTDNND